MEKETAQQNGKMQIFSTQLCSLQQQYFPKILSKTENWYSISFRGRIMGLLWNSVNFMYTYNPVAYKGKQTEITAKINVDSINFFMSAKLQKSPD